MRPPVIDGIEELEPAGRIEELDFLESGMPSSRLDCPLSLKTPNAVFHFGRQRSSEFWSDLVCKLLG